MRAIILIAIFGKVYPPRIEKCVIAIQQW
jgi:hypothetical protein